MFQVKPTTVSGRPTLLLEGELTIYTAAAARTLLRDALDAGPLPDLDLAMVTELDTAGAQLLVWLKREAALRGSSVAYMHHSAAVLEVLDLLSLAAGLGDPILVAPSRRD